MRASLPVLLLLLVAAAAAAPASAQQLDHELLYAHPGLAAGDYDAARADWLAALKKDPDSALAYDAALRIAEIDNWCAEPLAPQTLERLQRHVLDPWARAELAGLLVEADRRARAAGRAVVGHDFFQEWADQWRVAGPWGRLDAAEPLAAPAPLAGLQWMALPRAVNRGFVEPDDLVFPSAGGGCYAALLVRGEPGPARLLLEADERCVVWWNGAVLVQSLRETPTGGTSRFDHEVAVQEGWNLLLVATPVDSQLYLGARLCAPDGAPRAFEELRADAPLPAPWDTLVPDLGRAHAAPPGPAMVPGRAADAGARGGLMTALQGATRARLRGHGDRALAWLARVDTADEAEAALLRRARWLALDECQHLPSEVARGRMLTLEDEMLAAGGLDPRVGAGRAGRLLAEDRPEEALELLATLQEQYPTSWRLGELEVRALEDLDPRGTLARARLLALHEAFPAVIEFATRLGDLAGDSGAAAEEEHWAEVARGLGAYGSGNWDVLLDRAARRGGRGLRDLQELAEEWLDDEPGNGTAEWILMRASGLAGDDAIAVELYEDDLAKPGRAPGAWWSLGEMLLELGHPATEAVPPLLEAAQRQPSQHEVRALLTALGRPADEAEEFFDRFGPDVDAALAQRGSAGGASTALLLDHGMVYMLPDGGYQYRTHTLAEALDRAGTEELHEQWAQEYPLVTRVHDLSGRIYEPHQVDGSWVMPSLDPGDVVEQVYDRFEEGVPGVAPRPGSWRFASFSQPFLLSRWVLYVPDGMPGRFEQGNFDGTLVEERWRDGTVYIFEVRDRPRLEPELLMPSELEVLPWAEYGDDQPVEDHLRSWARWLRWQSGVAEDLAPELDAFVAPFRDEPDLLARAAALHRAVADHVLEFGGGGDLAAVWTQRRGDPTGLLAAAYARAGVPFEWALAAPTAPELDDSPVRPFATGEEFGVPLLRVVGGDGAVVWVRPDVRGAAFGALPATMAGAPVAVLEDAAPLALRWRTEELPRGGDDEVWNLDFQVKYVVSGEDASATGRIRITGAQGQELREQLSQVPAEQLDAVARQICSGLVEGMDLESSQFPGLKDAGAPLVLDFSGRIPGFVRVNSGGVAGARLRIPELGLSGGLGVADRRLPFAFRDLVRLRAVVELDCGVGWTLEYGPESRREAREGFSYDFQVTEEEAALRVERVLEMRGLTIPAAEFPGFLALLAELEKEESRAVKLTVVVRQ